MDNRLSGVQMIILLMLAILVGAILWALQCDKPTKLQDSAGLSMLSDILKDISTYTDANQIAKGSDLQNIVIKENTVDVSKLLAYTGNIPKTQTVFRPRNLDEFIGQAQPKAQASLAIQKVRAGERVHFCLSGTRGCGKTSFLRLMAQELDATLLEFIGKQVTIDAIVPIMNEINKTSGRVMLFIDEIDAVSPKVIKTLNSILEEFQIGGKQVKPFIFACATINLHQLIKKNPDTLDRIDEHILVTKYQVDDIMQILFQYARNVYPNATISDVVFLEMAQNGRYNPRTSITLLKDFVTCQDIKRVLSNKGIVRDGLRTCDIKALRFLQGKDKPIGVEYWASMMGMTMDEFKIEIEPFLLEYGYVDRTAKGRILTQKSKDLLSLLSTI